MFKLLKSQPRLLEEDSIEWIFNCYAWALAQFDRSLFFNETILVIPDNNHFPGREQSVEGIAGLIFDQVKKYACMAHWPTRLVNLKESTCLVKVNPPVVIDGALRRKPAAVELPDSETTGSEVSFSYDPQQLNNPEGLIAHFASGLSAYLASTASAPPPGGEEYTPIAGELTGVYLGFGIMFANSATPVRGGGCGGCGGQGPVRQVFLSEEEAAYALALFCVLKKIAAKKVVGHLNKHLRRFFKAAMKDCEMRIIEYSHLNLNHPH